MINPYLVSFINRFEKFIKKKRINSQLFKRYDWSTKFGKMDDQVSINLTNSSSANSSNTNEIVILGSTTIVNGRDTTKSVTSMKPGINSGIGLKAPFLVRLICFLLVATFLVASRK